MNSSETNSNLEDEEHENSTAIDQTLTLEANNRPKRIVHRFYFVKFWPYKDTDEASKVATSEQLIENLDQKLSKMDQEFKLLKLKWIDTLSQLDRLCRRESTISSRLDWLKETSDHLQIALDKHDSAILPHKHKRRSNHTQGYQSWLSHGSSNLVMERKLIKAMARIQHRLNDLDLEEDIRCYTWGNIDKPGYTKMLEKSKHIEDRPEKALADENAIVFNPLGVKNAMEKQIKIVNKMSLELREEQREVKAAVKRLEKQLKPMKDEAFVYRTRRLEMSKRKEAAQHCILKLRQTSTEMNGKYDEYASVLSNARELSRNKDIAALRELSHHQVEEFMSEWNQPYVKTFRVNYEASILDSLRNRRLCDDGRIEF